MKVFLTDTAKLDLLDIIDYYDSHNPVIADHFENELQHGLEMLREFPRVGHRGFSGLLELGFHDFPYVLSYQVLQDQVQIIAILHTARDREHALAIRTGSPARGQ
jgi:plasmid stabilization system protein ParE